MGPLEELEAGFREAIADPAFMAQVRGLWAEVVGRPSPLTFAAQLTERCGGAQLWLKREDLNHTGAHKINNTLAQCLLARRMGKTRIIAETGAGQHGVATATAAALLGMPCRVFMGREDCRRQRINVLRMGLLGAEVIPVDSGTKTLKDAINEAMRAWVTDLKDTFYCFGSAAGPHPYPWIVRTFQRVIGVEARAQVLARLGRLPTHVVACVGGGSNAIGAFHAFIPDAEVALVGVEAAGHGLESGAHSATLSRGSIGVLHGSRSYLLQDAHGQVQPAHSISAGLDYPGVGPEHASLLQRGRLQVAAVDDEAALAAFVEVSRAEGIIPALESSHALSHAMTLARGLPAEALVLVCLSGRGDKDIEAVAHRLGVQAKD
jgi:tryptophan synthase beta chain